MANVAFTKFGKAKARLLIKHPFFSFIALQTHFEESDRFPTAATDGVQVLYNPAFIESLDIEVVVFVIVHEIAHIFLKHALRSGTREHDRWNIACDHAINLMLKDSGLKLWDKCYADAQYSGMSAEQIYDLLEDDQSCGGGIGRDLIEPENGYSEAERHEIERVVDQTIAAAYTQAKLAGNLPANLERLIAGLLQPPLPWYQLLSEYMLRIAHETETWSRRNRRFENVYLPSRYDRTMGELVIIGDTSGSMPSYVFGQVGVEVNSAVETVKPERVRVVWADAEDCSAQQVFEPGDTVEMKPEGGGGTDMRLPLRFVEQYDPCVVVLVTDCETPWPDQPTPYPLIVVSTTKAPSPDWAMRVEIYG